MRYPPVRPPRASTWSIDRTTTRGATALFRADPAEPGDDDRDRDRADRADADRFRQQRAHRHLSDDRNHEQPFEHRDERPDEECQRLRARRGRIAEDEHHRLNGDSADQVPGGEPEMSTGRSRDGDRDLRQRARNREQDHAAERLAEVVAPVDRVGRLRKCDPGDPRDGGRSSEDPDQDGCGERADRRGRSTLAGDARDTAAPRRRAADPTVRRRPRTGGCSGGFRDRSRRRRSARSWLRRPNFRLQRLEPQAEQKTFANPSGGSKAARSSWPWRMRSEPGSSLACGEAEEPVRRWQRLQWHQRIRR